MEKDENYYKSLLELYLENRCNPSQLEEVLAFLEKDSSNRLLLLQLQEQFKHSSTATASEISPEQSQNIRENLLQKINKGKVVALNKRKWTYVAAAAAILFVTTTVYYLSKPESWGEEKITAKTSAKTITYKNDVSPGTDKAMLTLADGSTIVLDDAHNGNLLNQGNTQLTKLDGELAYDAITAANAEVVYNTISTPRGGKFKIELSDGSVVWLNAASSLHFPTAFAGKTRKVEMTGEAYFDIAKNKDKPFIVTVNGAEVQVLGTHFNVMAYPDEETVKTTLLEGSVKFTNGNHSSMLVPGQQSQLLKNGELKTLDNIDVDYVISWRRGMFHFENADIEDVLRQLSRWYDVEVEFKGRKLHDPLHAEFPLNTNLSDALNALESTGSAKFEIEGKKIIVTQ
jgi:ferric-dicitrate binding protein FerR (iron transport regulator)